MMKQVLVVGTARGLGYTLVKQFLEAGCKVFGAVLPGSVETHQELKEKYGDALMTVEMDVSSEESVVSGFEKIKAETQVLDIVVNVAGILPKDSHLPLEEVNLNGFVTAFQINTMGAMRAVKYALPLLRAGEEKVILNVSSAGGSLTHITELDPTTDDYPYAYCMSKAALNMGSAILQRYCKPDGIKVICVHPGVMRTAMNADADEETKKTLVDPEISAECIRKLIALHKGEVDGPLFYNYTGEVFPF